MKERKKNKSVKSLNPERKDLAGEIGMQGFSSLCASIQQYKPIRISLK